MKRKVCAMGSCPPGCGGRCVLWVVVLVVEEGVCCGQLSSWLWRKVCAVGSCPGCGGRCVLWAVVLVVEEGVCCVYIRTYSRASQLSLATYVWD